MRRWFRQRRKLRQFERELQARGFRRVNWMPGRPWLNSEMETQVILTRLRYDATLVEAEVYDRRFRPDVSLVYEVDKLVMLLVRPEPGAYAA